MINTGFLPPLQQSSTRKCKTHHAIYFSQPVNQIAGIQITEGNGSALKESFLMESSYTYCLWGNKKKNRKSNVVAILLRCCSVGADPRHYVPNKTVITFQSRRPHTVRRCLKRLNHWASESPLLVHMPRCHSALGPTKLSSFWWRAAPAIFSPSSWGKTLDVFTWERAWTSPSVWYELC